jgi:hypothetical protein
MKEKEINDHSSFQQAMLIDPKWMVDSLIALNQPHTYHLAY